MALVAAICSQCGAKIDVDESSKTGICPFCGMKYIIEQVINKYYKVFNVTNNIANATFSLHETEEELSEHYHAHLKLLNIETEKDLQYLNNFQSKKDREGIKKKLGEAIKKQNKYADKVEALNQWFHDNKETMRDEGLIIEAIETLVRKIKLFKSSNAEFNYNTQTRVVANVENELKQCDYVYYFALNCGARFIELSADLTADVEKMRNLFPQRETAYLYAADVIMEELKYRIAVLEAVAVKNKQLLSEDGSALDGFMFLQEEILARIKDVYKEFSVATKINSENESEAVDCKKAEFEEFKEELLNRLDAIAEVSDDVLKKHKQRYEIKKKKNRKKRLINVFITLGILALIACAITVWIFYMLGYSLVWNF